MRIPSGRGSILLLRSLLPLLLVLAVLVPSASTQVTPEREAAYQRYLDFGSLIEGGRITPNWMPDGNSFWYAEGGPQHTVIHRVDPNTGTVDELFDTPRLRAVLTEALGHEPAGLGVPFRQLSFAGYSSVQFTVEGQTFVLNLDTYAVERRRAPSSLSLVSYLVSETERMTPKTFVREVFQGLGPRPYPERLSPDGQWFVGLDNHNLTLRATVDGRVVPLTDDGNEFEQWDVETTLWNPWSPGSQRLVVARIDSRGMPRIPTIKWLKPLEEAEFIPTMLAGGELYDTRLHILDLHTRTPMPVEQDTTADYYYRVLTWLPDGSEVVFARYSRVMDRVDIQAADAATGAVRTLATEVSATFVTHHHDAVWGSRTGFRLLPDASGFILVSERDGWRHLYLYDMDGNLVRRLTEGDFPVEGVVSVDQENEWVYFTAQTDPDRPYDLHLNRVTLEGSGRTQLTEGKGRHTVAMAPSHGHFVDTYSSVDTPPRSVLRRADGELVLTLSEADISRLEEVGWTPPREIVVKAADGQTDMWVTMYLPHDFNPARRYPVVEYIYGGPQTTTRPMDFGGDPFGLGSDFARMANFNRALANMGFIVVILDARGTPGRSKAFHDVIVKNWGRPVVADHAAAIRQLIDRFDFLDGDRVGIMGASWGGYYSTRAILEEPDLYKVSISEVPGYDMYAFHLYEPYLGMPQQNRDHYEAANVFRMAPNLKGQLLLIGGINDTGTQADLFQMSETLVRAGIQHDMMVYANTGHGALGQTGEYNFELKKDYFVKYLVDRSHPGSRLLRP